MSNILLAERNFGCWEDAEWLSDEIAFSEKSATEELVLGPFKALVSRVDNMDLWGPASDWNSGDVAVLCGRIAASDAEWRLAEDLPYRGGLACRLILDRWHQSPDSIQDWLNGAFFVIVWEEKNQALHMITDRMGMFPAYALQGERICLASHPDLLAEAAKRSGIGIDLDRTTLLEFIATGSATHPHTYYQQIKQLDPATRYGWKDGPPWKRQSRRYWQPAYIEQMPGSETEEDYQALAEELAFAFGKAISLRTHSRVGKVGVMLSGGLDSRIMLAGLANPENAEAITFCDEENDEVKTACRIANAVGARHHIWKRDPEYYTRGIPMTVRISGGMWSVESGHYTGFRQKLDELGIGVLLTGCYADYMFKGLSVNRTHRTLFGRNLPLFELTSFAPEYYHPHFQLSDVWGQRVSLRTEERFDGMTDADYERNPLLFEARRIQPLSREPDSSGRLFLWRTQPFDSIFSDNAVLDVYGRIPIGGKINGRVYELAVKRVCGPGLSRIYNNNYKTAVGAGETTKMIQFVRASLTRKMKSALRGRQRPESILTTGSWPDFQYVLKHSAVIQNMRTGEHGRYLECLLEMVHPSQRNDVWSHNPTLAFRLLTAAEWLRQRAINV